MAILKIETFPSPVLRRKAEEITSFDAALEKLSLDMLETMYDAPGVGLAANQIGVAKRIVVIDVDFKVEGEDESSRRISDVNPRILVNPVITEKSGKVLFTEGCLSVPGFSEAVSRFEKIKVKYQNIKGDFEEFEAEDLLAICVQHELDHLDGKLFVDRLSEIKKTVIRNKLTKGRVKKFDRSRFHVEL